MPNITEKFRIDSADFGQFAGIYYITYAAAHIPIGTLLDKKGPKYVVPACILITILGTLPLILSDSWIVVCIGRALIGFGSAGAILGLFKVTHIGFPRHQFARVVGIGAFVGLMGALYGGKPLAYLIATYGYETIIKYLIYAGLLFALIAVLVMPKAKGIRSDEVNLRKDLAEIWKHKDIIYISLFAGLMVGPLEGFADAWGAAFMQNVYSMDRATASFLTSIVFLGMAFGSSLIAYLGEKTKSYYSVIISCAAMMTIFFVVIMLKITTMTYILMCLFFMIGILSGYQILTTYLSTTFVREGVVGLTTAIVNMIVMSFGYLFHSVIGKMLSLTWDGTMIDGAKAYSSESYIYSISVIPICLAIGGLGFFWLRSKQRKAANLD